MAHRIVYSRRIWLGGLLWISSLQYFIVQLLVGLRWQPAHPYSIAGNTISDLGNTHCGLYGSKYVCSPVHSLMNASFLVLGITMILGAIALLTAYQSRMMKIYGSAFIALAGLGTVMVGLFPENTIAAFHIIGASMPFVLGNIGMLGFGLDGSTIPRGLRYYSRVSGLIGLVGLVGFVTHHYGFLGAGGMERVAVYPLTIWLIVMGLYYLNHRHISGSS